MTSADDLPAHWIPRSYAGLDAIWHPAIHQYATAYALAARAERDALFETQRKTLESQRDELMRQCGERDAEIERLQGVEQELYAIMKGHYERAEAAEERVKELEHQLEIAEHDSVHQSQLYSEYAEEWTRERDTLQKRVAELEEACAMKDRIIRNLHPEASGLRARLETLETRLEATRNGYGYLQDRLASVGYSGWAHDMDSEINSTY